MTRSFHRPLAELTLLVALCTAAAGAQAQATIDQTKALAGGINRIDTAGFPITLNQSGHYRLTGNLVVPPGVNGIEIQGHNITLDLNGFTISGPATCSRNAITREVTCSNMSVTEYHGIATLAPMQGVTVRNGNVRGFNRGVRLIGQGRIEGLTATHNGHGLGISNGGGTAGLIVDSRAEMNSATGISVDRGQILRSASSRNGRYGFTGPGAQFVQVVESVASANAKSGFVGVSLRGSLATENATPNRSLLQSLGQNIDEQGVY